MALSKAEFDTMHAQFVHVSNQLRGKRDTAKFLKAVVRDFGYSDVIDLRKNFSVVLERNGNREIHAYAQSSDRFYQVSGQSADGNGIAPKS